MLNIERSMAQYLDVYKSLYKRQPSELRDLGNNWVQVNGARMTIGELENLTTQLQSELQQERSQKRSLVNRLLKFFQPNT